MNETLSFIWDGAATVQEQRFLSYIIRGLFRKAATYVRGSSGGLNSKVEITPNQRSKEGKHERHEL